MAGSFPGGDGPSVGALSGEALARAIMRDPTAAPAPTAYQGHQPVVIQQTKKPVARTSEGIPVGDLPYVAQFDMRTRLARPTWTTPMALPAEAPMATEEERAAAEASPSEPVARVTGGGGTAVPSGYGPGVGGYYGPDYLANLVRAREEGRISEKQFDAGAMAYNKAMTGTSAGLELAAGRQDAALQQRAMGMDAETARAYADAQAKENEALTIAAQKDAERAEAFEARRQQFLQDAERRQNEMDALASEIRSTKIDPNAYWANRNGFSTMLSLFAVGLGGYVEGKSQGRVQNKALAMVENAIDRDIAAQKANLENKRGAAEVMRGAYGMARQRLGDEQAAEDYSRSLLWDQFAKVAQRYRGEARTQELANSAAKIELQANAISKQFENRAKIAFARSDEARRAAAAQAAASAPMRDLKLRRELAEIKKLEGEAGAAAQIAPGVYAAKPEMVARYVPEAGGFAGSEKIASELNEGVAAARQAIKIVERMKTLRATGDTGGFGTDAATYDALRSQALGAFNKAEKFGALDNGTTKVLGEMIPESALFSFDAKAVARLDAAQAGAESRVNEAIKAATIIPGEIVMTESGPGYRYSTGPVAPKPVKFTPAK